MKKFRKSKKKKVISDLILINIMSVYRSMDTIETELHLNLFLIIDEFN